MRKLTAALLALWCFAFAQGASAETLVEVKNYVTLDSARVAQWREVQSGTQQCALEFKSGWDVLAFHWETNNPKSWMTVWHRDWSFAPDGFETRVRLFFGRDQVGHADDGSQLPWLLLTGSGQSVSAQFSFEITKYLAPIDSVRIEFVDQIAPDMRFDTRGMPVLLTALAKCRSDIGNPQAPPSP